MKKILLIDNSRPTKNGGIGGSINSMLQLIERIDKNQFKIYVLLYYKLPLLEKQLRKIEVTMIYKNNFLPQRINNVKQKTKNNFRKFLPFYSDLHIIKNINHIKYISSIINKYKIDVVHGNNRISANTLCLLAAKKCDVPYIQHQRMFENKLSVTAKINKNYPDFYFAISNPIKDNINKIVNISEKRIRLIYNWINSDFLIKSNRVDNNITFKILWIGRIVPWKGLDILINIANELKNNNFGDFKIDIFGDFSDLDYKKNLLKMIEKLGLDDIINFKGFKIFQDINNSEYSVYIHTSKSPEPFGRTIIENMLAKIPVCATSMGGVLDIINHKDNGILYNHKNYKELVPILVKLKSDNEFRDKLIINAKKTISEKFSGDLQIKLIEKIYKSI